VPSGTLTSPVATRCPLSFKVMTLRCRSMGNGSPCGSTVKFVELVAVPPGVVTRMGPVVAVAGTVAVICVSEFTVNAAETRRQQRRRIGSLRCYADSSRGNTGEMRRGRDHRPLSFVLVNLVAGTGFEPVTSGL
jgi:hypothetical protein